MSKVFYTEHSAALRLSGVNNAQERTQMSKSTSLSSCRAVLAGAITMPIAAAVIVPAHAEADDAELLRLGDEVKGAYDRLGDAITAYSVVEEKWFRWQRSNPEPDEELAARSNWLERENSFLRESGLGGAPPRRSPQRRQHRSCCA